MYKLCTTSRKLKFVLVSCDPVLTSFIVNKTCVGNIIVPHFITALRPRDRRLVVFRRRDQAIQLLPLLWTMPLKFFSSLRRIQLLDSLLIIHARNILPHTLRTHCKLANPNPSLQSLTVLGIRISRIPKILNQIRIILPDLEVLRHLPVLVHNPKPLQRRLLRRRRRPQRWWRRRRS
uniref:Uncharacterized protein n=1 Tax=Opuntia streptacantha TaxID=393608 RepID=A0A7C9AJ85_OPUST